MENLNYPCIYLYGAQLWIALALFCIIFIGFIIIGRSYLAAERKADGLQVKYNREKADRLAAEWELESMKLKGSGAERHTGTFPTSNDQSKLKE